MFVKITKPIGDILNTITMYRLMLYYLIFLWAEVVDYSREQKPIIILYPNVNLKEIQQAFTKAKEILVEYQKNILGGKISKVSRSSLTPIGFNAALELIKAEAKSSS